MKEVWKQIEEFPDYQVSNTGKVKSTKGCVSKILSMTSVGRVQLRCNNKKHEFYVKQLVAKYFLGYDDSPRHIHLKDGDPCNCSLDNLQIDSDIANKLGEVWKPLDICPAKYMISNMGRVKALSTSYTYTNKFGTPVTRTRKEHLVNVCGSESGVPVCTLSVFGELKRIHIHTCVAKAFVPNPNRYNQVGFKNGDFSDCRSENLYWYEDGMLSQSCEDLDDSSEKPCNTSSINKYESNGTSDDTTEVNLYTALPCEVKEEIWKTIPGFENYEISNTGFVRSSARKNPVIRKVSKCGNVVLMKYGSLACFPAKWLAIHSFFGKSVSNHSIENLDGDVTNFRLDNLKVNYDEEYPSDELWATVDGLSNYQVSNKGRIRSLDMVKYLPSPRYFIINGHVHHSRSRRAQITLDPKAETGSSTSISVPFAIAKAFVPNPDEKYYRYVTFKDGDFMNMSADNLQWTHAADMNDSTAPTIMGLHIICLETGEYYPSAGMLIDRLGVSPQDVYKSFKHGKTFIHGGKTYILEQDYDKLQEKNS